ncbi:phosphoribosylanthranilate isomerase [Neisseria animalis]|uniref:N-(5'-phosphoribosyl)anthranilate isomerase n=1 Tax=Neisseria animalis TaxID=492 RepID=A0A5P3MRT1_NEIAN|nr:phosphoribosylanthranilate isomerase [Neisseria animalis]QEY24313.1 phosphoribosylanthranilate isomerase [Neisseria animalis]ROW32284.1 phosphoribosylanthranilate isomerase [Neisseria animalis]VEE06757.1 N-(5'-phosphoribosyl)anthranilate isomerase [Neisseria animalis]
MTVRTKICGITRPEDARAAAQAGADAVGLVFYAKSKRAVTIAQAQAVVNALPPFISVVALFVNETADTIRKILRQVPIDVIQFHGDEDDDFCRQFDRPYLKAVRVRGAADIQTASARFPHARAILFDAYHPEEYGGTGLQFDWNLLREYTGKPWILAGGLTPENVAEAVRISGAAAVDVSGGVEERGGVKDHAKIRAFVGAVS